MNTARFSENLGRHLIFGCFVSVATNLFLLMASHATGINGFEPTSENVRIPFSGNKTLVWNQVGSCGASSVQLSPSWILSTNHAPCLKGFKFKRQDGAFEYVGEDAPAMVGYNSLGLHDLHLSRLVKPLPYSGGFVPLIENFNMPKGNSCQYFDVLLAGNGLVEGVSKFQVGWAPTSSNFHGFTAPAAFVYADPTFLGNAGATPGDSGGGVFLFGKKMPAGGLVGLMHSGSEGIKSSKLFPSEVRSQIDAVLADPVLNPSGERVQWVTSESISDLGGVPAPLFLNVGGAYTSPIMAPEYGLAYTYMVGSMLVGIPQPYSCTSSNKIDPDAGYRIRLVSADPDPEDQPIVVDTPSNKRTVVISRGVNVHPGKWFMTVTARSTNVETGQIEESLAADRVELEVPQVVPLEFDHVDVKWEIVDRGDGKPHWDATIFPVPNAEGPIPQGVLYGGPYNKKWSRTIDLGQTDALVVSDTDRNPSYVAGDRIVIYAFPYIGAALGPATVITLVVPESL